MIPEGQGGQLEQIRSDGEVLLIRQISGPSRFLLGTLVVAEIDKLGLAIGCTLRTTLVEPKNILAELRKSWVREEPTLNQVIGSRHFIGFEINVSGKNAMLSISPFRLGESGSMISLFVSQE